MKTRTIASATAIASVGWSRDAGVAREILMSGNAAERRAGTRRPAGPPAPSFDRDGLKADVVGILQRRDAAAAVECDIELARQPVERAIVEDVVVPCPGVRARVDQLVRDRCRRSQSP